MKLISGAIVTGSLAGCTSNDTANTPTMGNQTPTTMNGSTSTETTTATTTTTNPTTTTKTTTQQSGTDVTFSTSEGKAKGTLYGSGSCAVIFAPGKGYDRTDWAPQASAIADAGHTALSVSLDSKTPFKNHKTIAGAVAYLRKKKSAKTVVAVGASAGANAVVKANTIAGTTIDGSVVISPGDAAAYAPDLSGRKLFICGKNDKERYVQTTKGMHQQAPDPKRIELLPTNAHGQDIFGTDQGTSLKNMIVEFSNTVCSG